MSHLLTQCQNSLFLHTSFMNIPTLRPLSQLVFHHIRPHISLIFDSLYHPSSVPCVTCSSPTLGSICHPHQALCLIHIRFFMSPISHTHQAFHFTHIRPSVSPILGPLFHPHQALCLTHIRPSVSPILGPLSHPHQTLWLTHIRPSVSPTLAVYLTHTWPTMAPAPILTNHPVAALLWRVRLCACVRDTMRVIATDIIHPNDSS